MVSYKVKIWQNQQSEEFPIHRLGFQNRLPVVLNANSLISLNGQISMDSLENVSQLLGTAASTVWQYNISVPFNLNCCLGFFSVGSGTWFTLSSATWADNPKSRRGSGSVFIERVEHLSRHSLGGWSGWSHPDSLSFELVLFRTRRWCESHLVSYLTTCYFGFRSLSEKWLFYSVGRTAVVTVF